MKLLLALSLGLVAITAASVISPQDRHLVDALSQTKNINRAFGDELRALLENLRELIGAGDPELGIPVLDPYERDTVEGGFAIPGTAEFRLSGRDLNVQGLQGFIVNDVDFNILRLRLDFDFTLPSLKIKMSHYDLLGSLADFEFPLTGEAEIEFVNIGFKGSAFLAVRNGFLHMSAFTNELSLEALICNITGLSEDPETNDVINQIVGTIVPGLVEAQGELISETIEMFVTEFANQFLNEITLADLIDIITGGGGRGSNPAIAEALLLHQ